MSGLTHFDAEGKPQMVDVSPKETTIRTAIASGCILISAETLDLINSNQVQKGDVLAIAHLAGIMGAKRTADLIPLCHPIALDGVQMELKAENDPPRIEIRATAKTAARTGVEMEALTAVSVAALTIYDMCKARDRGMMISDIRLTHKSGGKSGTWPPTS